MGARQAQSKMAFELLTFGPPRPYQSGWVCSPEVLPTSEPSLALVPEPAETSLFPRGGVGRGEAENSVKPGSGGEWERPCHRLCPGGSAPAGPGQEPLSLGPCKDGHLGIPLAAAPAPCLWLGAGHSPSLEAGVALALEWGERETCFWPAVLPWVGLPPSALSGMDRPAGRLNVTTCREGAG